MRTINMLRLLVLFMVNYCLCLNTNMIRNTLEHLDFKPPISITGTWPIKIKLANNLMENQKYLVFKNKYIASTVCCQDLQKLNQVALEDEKSSTLIIPNQAMFYHVLETLECSIDEEVFMMNEVTKEIFEAYTINKVKTVRKIAWVDDDYTLHWLEDKNMITRRSNFHGLYLKSYTGSGSIGDWAKVKPNFASEAPYFANNGTYDVTNHLSGVVFDVVSIMKSELNFTTNYYKRKDNQIGAVIEYANGTYGGVGIIPDLFHGKVDIIATPIVMKTMRIPYMDFLPPNGFIFGKLIQNNSLPKNH